MVGAAYVEVEADEEETTELLDVVLREEAVDEPEELPDDERLELLEN